MNDLDRWHYIQIGLANYPNWLDYLKWKERQKGY